MEHGLVAGVDGGSGGLAYGGIAFSMSQRGGVDASKEYDGAMSKSGADMVFAVGTLFRVDARMGVHMAFLTTTAYLWFVVKFIMGREVAGWVAIGFTVLFVDLARCRKRHNKPPFLKGLRRWWAFLWLRPACQRLANRIDAWNHELDPLKRRRLYTKNHISMHVLSWRIEKKAMIPSPDENDDPDLWLAFLVTLIGRVRSGRFDDLSSILEEVKQEGFGIEDYYHEMARKAGMPKDGWKPPRPQS